MNKLYQTRGAMLVGPVIPVAKLITGETLGVLDGNKERLLELAKRFRVRRHVDGWFVDGARHACQIWEHGTGRLGLTVVGSKLIPKFLNSPWLTKAQLGDGEANFNCPWDDEHLGLLSKLCKLQKRRAPGIAT